MPAAEFRRRRKVVLYDPAAFGERLLGTIDLLRIRPFGGAADAVGFFLLLAASFLRVR